MRRSLLAVLASTLLIASCGGSSDTDSNSSSNSGSTADAADVTLADEPAGGLATVSPTAAAEVIAGGADDLVVLDVRTPEEFAEGHLDGAVLVDFYDADFRDQLAGLDPDVPYVLYCRSGNRSGETLEIMGELGFGSVDNVDGGILAWADAGLPVVVD